jgi:hypothetical protein
VSVIHHSQTAILLSLEGSYSGLCLYGVLVGKLLVLATLGGQRGDGRMLLRSNVCAVKRKRYNGLHSPVTSS